MTDTEIPLRSGQDPSTPAAPSLRTFAAAEGAAVVPGVVPVRPSLAMLLAAHILRDGELVILILRPSLWFILLSGIRFIAGVLILMTIARVETLRTNAAVHIYMELGIFAIAGRLMWAIVQWMGQLYVLTDMRVLVLSGVFHIHVFDCPLRKIARTRVLRAAHERLLMVGSIEIIPQDNDYPFGQWQTVDQPDAVNRQIVATISRAKGNSEC
jgi:hypothetical protein